MKKLWLSSLALVLLLTGCNEINTLIDSKKELIHKTKIDDLQIEVLYDKEFNDFMCLDFKVNGKTYGLDCEQGGFLSDDERYFYYFDDKSIYEIYEDRVLVEPLEIFNWKEEFNGSIYKLDSTKEIEAFYNGTTDLDGIAQTFVLVPTEKNVVTYEKVDFDALALLRLISKGEQIFPERGGLAVESCELPPHQVALQSASIPFNKEVVQFYPRTTELMLSVSDPYKGIVKFTTWQLYGDFSDKDYYYQLTNEQIAEFDRITKYNETVQNTSIE